MAGKIEGLAGLNTALGDLPRATARNTLIRTGKKALEPFLADVKQLAPVDAPSDTPERAAESYKDSWIIGTRLNDFQKGEVRKGGKSFAEVYAGTTQPGLGSQLEHGTVERISKKTGKNSGVVAPQPHARPAWDGTQKQVLDIVAKELWAEIEKSAQRLAKRRR